MHYYNFIIPFYNDWQIPILTTILCDMNIQWEFDFKIGSMLSHKEGYNSLAGLV